MAPLSSQQREGCSQKNKPCPSLPEAWGWREQGSVSQWPSWAVVSPCMGRSGGVVALFSHLRLLPPCWCTRLKQAPSPLQVAGRAVFYFRSLIQPRFGLTMAHPFNHRYTCSGQSFRFSLLRSLTSVPTSDVRKAPETQLSVLVPIDSDGTLPSHQLNKFTRTWVLNNNDFK